MERREHVNLTKIQTSKYPKDRALAAAIGIHPSQLSRIKTGKALPTMEQMRRLCTALTCTPPDIYAMEEMDLPNALKFAPGRRKDNRGERYKRLSIRILRDVATSIPDDFLEVLGFESWNKAINQWLEACMEEYRQRKGPADAETIDRAGTPNTNIISDIKEESQDE